jgi:hypothetical protein
MYYSRHIQKSGFFVYENDDTNRERYFDIDNDDGMPSNGTNCYDEIKAQLNIWTNDNVDLTYDWDFWIITKGDLGSYSHYTKVNDGKIIWTNKNLNDNHSINIQCTVTNGLGDEYITESRLVYFYNTDTYEYDFTSLNIVPNNITFDNCDNYYIMNDLGLRLQKNNDNMLGINIVFDNHLKIDINKLVINITIKGYDTVCNISNLYKGIHLKFFNDTVLQTYTNYNHLEYHKIINKCIIDTPVSYLIEYSSSKKMNLLNILVQPFNSSNYQYPNDSVCPKTDIIIEKIKIIGLIDNSII